EVEQNKIEDNLFKIRNKVDTFKQLLCNVKSTPDFVEKLKCTMEDVECTINAFKENQRTMFQQLVEEEETLQQEIEVLEKRIQQSKQASMPSSSGSSKFLKRSTPGIASSSLPPEIAAYEKFIAVNGVQGGWDDYDHGLFIKIRNKHKGKSSFIAAAVNGIPGRRSSDVTAHEEWYKMFLELKEKKKCVIANWKMEKEKENMKKEIEFSLKAKEEEELKNKREKERMEEQVRLKNKESLEIWKQKKAEQRRREAEEIQQNELRKKKIKDKEKQDLDRIRSAAREQLRLKREEEERIKWKLDLEEEERRAMKKEQTLNEISRFQSRDQQLLELKLHEKRMKEEELKKKSERIERAKANIRVESDRNRLYRPTDAWLNRNNQKENDHKTQPGIVMPHRAVPSWRQGV
uniref:Coiled-coil domain-containing protein 112 n=1 Tax=Ciona savignyi TaxID=51511 RepID=H2YGT9_CIOSA